MFTSILIDDSLHHNNIFVMFAAGSDDISSSDVASLLKESIEIGHSPNK